MHAFVGIVSSDTRPQCGQVSWQVRSIGVVIGAVVLQSKTCNPALKQG
jgi:hypothetical protein